jgi:hypothetical protein
MADTAVQPRPGIDDAVERVAAAREKLTEDGDLRAPAQHENEGAFLMEADARLRAGASREDVATALRSAADRLEAGDMLGPMSVVEVASGGGVIGHYDRNPVDSVMDTGKTSAEGDSLVAQTAEVATPQGDASVLQKGANASTEDDEEGDEDEGYQSQSVDDLKDELRRRDLPVSGNKDELVARLEEDDASR